MISKKKLFWVCSTFIIFFYSFCEDKINVLCFTLPPYCYEQNGKTKGIAVDIFNAANEESHLGLSAIKIKPLSRTIKELDAGNTIALLLVRTSSRESKYQWIDVVYKDSFVFVNSKKNTPINTFDEARDVGPILTRSNASTEEILLLNKITNIDSSVSDEEIQYKKLTSGRANVWLVPQLTAEAIIGKYQTQSMYNIGMPVISVDFYIVASKNVSKEVIEKMRNALKKINKNDIYSRYTTIK